jgi:hypothetical protein
MPKLQLSFHGTFLLKKEDLRKILYVAAESEGLNATQEKLQEKTSLGNKKVSPMKSWAIRTGLVRKNFLSSEGKIIWEQDPYLESPITDWFMHFYLSFGTQGYKNVANQSDTTLQPPPSEASEWGGWSYFIFQFLPQQPTFTLDTLIDHSTIVFPQEASKSLYKNFRIVLRTYTESEALANGKILVFKDDQYVASQFPLTNPYMVGYFLAKLWERDFADSTSVIADKIVQQPLGLAPILGIESDTLQTYLNQLESLNIIEQRRTVSPAQIIRRWEDPLILLEKAYANE